MDQKLLKSFLKIVEDSDNIVFFGGAGVSTESGIPDFRSAGGLYEQRYQYKYPPEIILSHRFFMKHPEEFFEFYREKMDSLGVAPNITHKKLAELEERGKLKAVITQNIDGLHQKAGSKNVFELHGSVLRNYCMECGRVHTAGYVFNETKGIPRCQKQKCNGIVKPDVVLYEEPLDEEVVAGAVEAIADCDTLIIGGTSLTVHPASGLINYFRGENLILINKDATDFDSRADLVINESLGEVFKYL
ncbi:MAG: NAD-dependent protein deacylase [Clostridia bacterium]|nr:NAD-dependent protein deacylase [Clostridia bacterium]